MRRRPQKDCRGDGKSTSTSTKVAGGIEAASIHSAASQSLGSSNQLRPAMVSATGNYRSVGAPNGAAWRWQARRLLFLVSCCLWVAFRGTSVVVLVVQADNLKQEDQVIYVKIGAFLEMGAEELQAKMFTRTIKMINEERENASQVQRHRTDGWPPQPHQTTAGNAWLDERPKRSHNYRPLSTTASNAAASKQRFFKLEPMIEHLATGAQSTYEADIKACQLIELGAQAILGPSTDEPSIQHVQSICDNMEIPYFELRPPLSSSAATNPAGAPDSHQIHQAAPTKAEVDEASRRARLPSSFAGDQPPGLAKAEPDLTLNLYPPAHLLTSAYIDLIYAWNWTSFAIVYEDNQSMIKLQNLFRESSGSWTSKWQIRLFQFNPGYVPGADSSGSSRATSANQNERLLPPLHSHKDNNQRAASFRDLFWLIRQTGERNILLDVRAERLSSALKQAQQVGCMTEQYSFLITSLDLHNTNLEDFKYSRVKLTGFSLLHAQDATPQKIHPYSSPLVHSSTIVDDNYLLRLGLPVTMQHKPSSTGNEAHHNMRSTQYKSETDTLGRVEPIGVNRYKLSPPMELERAGDFFEPTHESMANDHLNLNNHKQSTQSTGSGGGHWFRRGDAAADRLVDFLVGQQLRHLTRVRLPLTSAIIHDSLMLYSLALDKMNPDTSDWSLVASHQLPANSSLNCGRPNTMAWLRGSSMVNYMRHTTFRGLTGLVAFDERGFRSGFKLDLLGMVPDVGLIKVGEWDSSRYDAADRFPPAVWEEDELSSEERTVFYGDLLRDYQRTLKEATFSINYTTRVGRSLALRVNRHIYERLYREHTNNVDTLIVTSKLSNPYFMLKEAPNKLVGNDQYEGFAVDLIHELSRLINFKYRWREVPDKKYGVKEVLANGSVSWNGIIGEIVRGNADLAVLDLTITAQREEAVDFTLPFMNTGISILFKKPTTKVTTLFSFLSPFSADVWAYVLAAYCGISTILYTVGHLSPYEWADPRPCRHSSSEGELLLRNQFSLLNSFWFTIGSLMQQGSDLTPRSMSTRTVAGIWYFFTLIMISSYTANLAAFLTVEKVVYPIESARDLSNQQEIKYGCVESGSTCTFFKDSQIDTYKRIHENMLKHKTYVKSNEHGQKRVEEGKFAFFMESTSIEYIVERNCNLTQIGGLLDSKGYGMATSKRSRFRRPYRTLLSEGILHLQETGVLHTLKNRWWKERRGGGTCTDDSKGGGVTELSLANVGGVFVVLLGGLAVSFLVAIVEFMWRSRREGSSRDRMCDQMMNDLKFALSCKMSVKPVSRARRDRLRRERSQRHEQLATNYQIRKQVWPGQTSNQQSSSYSSKNVSFEELLQANTSISRQQLLQHSQLARDAKLEEQAHLRLLAQAASQQQQQQQHQQTSQMTSQLANELARTNTATAHHRGGRQWCLHPEGSQHVSAMNLCQSMDHEQASARRLEARGEQKQAQVGRVSHRLESKRRLCLLSRQTIDADALNNHLHAT